MLDKSFSPQSSVYIPPHSKRIKRRKQESEVSRYQLVSLPACKLASLKMLKPATRDLQSEM
jgi:hypothetical protein